MRDGVALVVGGVASVVVSRFGMWIGIGVAFVVLHFFLFCNVLRITRAAELVWAGIYLGLVAVAIGTGAISWPMVLGISLGVTVVVAIIETRRCSYHGVGWKWINPKLPQWWQSMNDGGGEGVV